MSERDLQQAVVDLCGWLGLLVYHTHDSRRSQKGFPDLTIVGTRVVFAELKSAKGRLRPDQKVWAERLQATGAEWHLWRPADLPEIHLVLKGLAGR